MDQKLREKLGYKTVEGCWCCRFVFVKMDYDSGEDYYCNKGIKKRPHCGSVAMDGEEFRKRKDGFMSLKRDYKAWMKYSDERRVCAYGTCKCYKLKEVIDA